MRKLVFGLLALALFISSGESADKKKKAANAPITGKVFSVDAEKGSIRLLIVTKKKKESTQTDAAYQIDDDTKVIINGKEKKEYMGKEGLKDVKKDDQATVVLDADFKTISLTINPGGKK